MRIQEQYLALLFTLTSLIFSTSIQAENNDWQWRIEPIEHYQSFIHITQAGKAIARYEIACRPDRDPSPEIMERQAYIEALQPAGSSNQVLLARCHVGAHSQTVYAFDPYRDAASPVIEVTGYYYALWESSDDKLSIIYDRECVETKAKQCEDRFEAVKLAWPK